MNNFTIRFTFSDFEFIQTQSNEIQLSLSELTSIGRLLIVTSSSHRAMWIVQQLRELKVNDVLPLFFHGGGRKREQEKAQIEKLESSNVIVALPTRLKSVPFNFKNIDILAIDMHINEKGLNMLSIKDTLVSFVDVLSNKIIPVMEKKLKVALV